ncbi:DUF397 domain-containing protein [Streptomyces sp. NPDC092296]|uniref:DUF397 domain-containing protein n=1 Tax=Streptomyces sp. NPDC092296 TaxID=3366012 RepID=UPI0038052BFA
MYAGNDSADNADSTAPVWRKSSYSGANGQCVEVAAVPCSVAVRDSKDPQGPSLRFSTEAWAAFVAAAGRAVFDAA